MGRRRRQRYWLVHVTYFKLIKDMDQMFVKKTYNTTFHVKARKLATARELVTDDLPEDTNLSDCTVAQAAMKELHGVIDYVEE